MDTTTLPVDIWETISRFCQPQALSTLVCASKQLSQVCEPEIHRSLSFATDEKLWVCVQDMFLNRGLSEFLVLHLSDKNGNVLLSVEATGLRLAKYGIDDFRTGIKHKLSATSESAFKLLLKRYANIVKVVNVLYDRRSSRAHNHGRVLGERIRSCFPPHSIAVYLMRN
jgi:hypothetical protein